MKGRFFVPVPELKNKIHLVLNGTCDTILSEQGFKDHHEKEGVGNGGHSADIRKGRLTIHGQGP
jgi:hypothetical protein